MKRCLSILLTVLLIMSVCPMGLFTLTASAATSDYYTYIIENGEATITDVDYAISGDITIPSTIGGYPVTSIGRTAFYGCSRLTSVIIPDTVTSIGDCAFIYCSSLTSITIPDSVTSIGYSAFIYCSSITSITIPGSVTNIGDRAFDDCSSLTNITVDSKNEYYSSQNGVLFNKDKTELIFYPEGKTDTTYIIPNSVTDINDTAFNSCTNLVSITIPKGITELNEYMFYGCTKLANITVDNNNEYYSSQNGVLFNKDKTELIFYPEGKTDTTYVIPNSVTDINYTAFESWSNLVSITIPKGITKLGEYAFDDCTKLANIIVDNNNEYYSSQNGVLFNKDKTELILYPAGKAEASYTIPDGVTSVGDWAFEGCSSLISITIPDSVTYFGEGAFIKCKSLSSVTIGAGVTNIWEGTFYGCSSLKNITVNSNNEYCSSENGVLFTKNKKTLITYPAGKTETSYMIPNSVIRISESAFSDCTNLASVTIPKSVTEISDWAFDGCTSLTDVWYSGSESDRANIDYFGENIELNNATWHYNTCSGEHTYTNACDTSCEKCEWTRTITHSYKWVIDQSATCGKAGTKHEECSVCHTKRNQNTVISATGNHTYSNACDTSCNVCGKTRTTTHSYTNACDTSCNVCGKTRSTTHKYDNSADTVCNICGYKKPVPTTVTSTKYTVKGSNLSKITAGTNVSTVLSGLGEGTYCKVYKGNSQVSGSTAIGTGMVVKIMDGNTVKSSYTVVVTGDTNGDGATSVTDMISIKAHVLKKSTLSGAYATAADTNGDKKISITDFIQIKAKILGKGTITAR